MDKTQEKSIVQRFDEDVFTALLANPDKIDLAGVQFIRGMTFGMTYPVQASAVMDAMSRTVGKGPNNLALSVKAFFFPNGSDFDELDKRLDRE